MEICIPDFDPFLIAHSGQCFRMQATAPDTISAFAGDRHLVLRVLGNQRFDFLPDRGEEDIPFWRRYFDLETDYESLSRDIPGDDEYLHACCASGRGLRILRQDPFETLISFIISQRKSIPAISRCIDLLCQSCGHSRDFGYAFPTPEAICALSDTELRACGLGYRVPYVRDSSRMVLQCGLPDVDTQMATSELEKTLLAFPGVGIKVANCVLLFGFHRLSAAPVDVWIQRIIDRHYSGINPFPGFGANAGLYQQYMFLAARDKK